MPKRTAAIDERIATGVLRVDDPVANWGGHGGRLLCDGCGERVTLVDLEVQSDFSDGQALTFHVRCFAIWQMRVRSTRVAS